MTLNIRNLFGFLVLTCGFALSVSAQVATGGSYTLEQTVMASGGGLSTGGSFTIVGTSGQSAAGANSVSQTLGNKGGFWTAQPLNTTAASVTIGGHITTASGQGIGNVIVTLTQADGTRRVTRSASLGYYHFDEIVVGQIVVMNATAKRFQFSEPTQVLNLFGETNNIDFVAVNQD